MRKSTRAAGHIFVVAAGNNSTNNDLLANYPSNYGYDNLIAVASTDSKDAILKLFVESTR